MTTQTYAEIKGTVAQVKWAKSIREQALREEGWTNEQLETLQKVADSTWWIANRHDLPHLSYKIPNPHQVAGGPPAPVRAQNIEHRQMDLARDSANEMTDAAAFAASVATKPKLAEVTVLALLARLYKKGSPQSNALVAKASEIMREGKYERDERDLDAIARILRPLN